MKIGLLIIAMSITAVLLLMTRIRREKLEKWLSREPDNKQHLPQSLLTIYEEEKCERESLFVREIVLASVFSSLFSLVLVELFCWECTA